MRPPRAIGPAAARRGMRGAASAGAILVLACLHGAALSAQVVRGRVIDDATGAPVTGAWVALTSATGAGITGVLTNESGRFLLPRLHPGRFTLRVEMIGRQAAERALALATTDTLDLDLRLSLMPVALASIDITSSRRCEVRPGTGSETNVVWQEARKALRVEAALRAENAFRFAIEQFERELDASRSRVLRESTRHISRFTGTPFSSMPAGYLAEHGFLDARPDGNYLYGPNAEVLLSDAFLDTHCMYLRRDGDRPGSIALAFEPVPGRDVTDIRGALWLDETTGELRSLEFGYTRIPATLAQGDYGGTATFLRLPSGAWIVRDWRIRSPIARIAATGFRAETVPRQTTTGFHVEGAQVLAVHDRSGHVVYTSDRVPRTVEARPADAESAAAASADAARESGGARTLEERGFVERMRRGPAGRFITRDEIGGRNAALLTDLLRDLPGVRVLPLAADTAGGGARPEHARQTLRFPRSDAPNRSADAECEPALFIDAVRTPGTAIDFNAVPVSRIQGIEVYLGTLVPPEFADPAGCGAVLVWTRRP